MRSLTREEGEAPLARQKSRPVGRAASRKAPTPKERDIQRAILAFLATVPGVVAFPYKPGMFRLTHKGKERMVRTGRRGVSDIVGWQERTWCPHGYEMRKVGSHYGDDCIAPIARFLAIEVKRLGQYPTAEQQAFLDAVKAAGGIAVCARSVHDVALALGLAAPASGAGARPGGAADGR